MNTISLKMKGTPYIKGWVLGALVETLSELKVGDVLLDVSDQFDAQNLMTVTRVGNNIVPPAKIVCGRFVDPKDGHSQRASGDQEFAVWDFMLGVGWGRLYHVCREAATAVA